MQRFVDYIATKRGMSKSLRILITTNSTLFSDVSGRVTLALRRLVEAAVADGSIRSDVDSSDVLHALGGIYSAPDTGLARPLAPAGHAADGRIAVRGGQGRQGWVRGQGAEA